MSHPAIVNSATNEVKIFRDVKEITIGRNVTSSIDVPSTYVSRTQCIIKLTENNQWTLTDLSRHQTTLLNNNLLQNNSPILSDGDKISFLHYKDAEYLFYNSIFNASNPAKKRKLDDIQPDIDVDVLTSTHAINETGAIDDVKIPPKNHEIEELSNELAALKEKYDIALHEINNQRILNETITQKLDIVLKESSDTVSTLQKEKEFLKSKLNEEQSAKEKMMLEVQELNQLLKDSELEQMRLIDECKCKNPDSDNIINGDGPKLLSKEEGSGIVEADTASEADTLQKLVEIVEMKWNEQEMEHMREELKKRDEKLTEISIQSERFRSEILEAIDHEFLCSICSDIFYEATTLNCRHTLCKFCVAEWKKKKNECPVCRTKIKTETQSLVIDSFIDKIAENFGGEMKARRLEVKQERASKSRKSSRKGSGSYNRSNRRAREFNTISSAMSYLHPLVIDMTDHFGSGMVPPPVIDLTDSPSNTRRRGGRLRPNVYSYAP